MDELIFEERKVLEKFFKENLSNKNGRDLRSRIKWLLKYIGISYAHKGYQYICEAIILAYNDENVIDNITKILYPTIARKFSTTYGAAEKSIRYSIEQVFKNDISDEHKKIKIFIFGVLGQKKKVTNAEFIADLVNFIKEYC